MNVSGAYATAAQYRAATLMTDVSQDVEILMDLTAVSRYLDGKLGRFFTRDITLTERIYIPSSCVTGIWINDLPEIPDSVKIDTGRNGLFETILAVTDYELQPVNANTGSEPRPFTRIELVPWGTVGCFKSDERVKITGRFGWLSVPDAVQRAAIHLTAILRLESPRATNRVAELGESIEASPAAQGILRQLTDQYKIWRV